MKNSDYTPPFPATAKGRAELENDIAMEELRSVDAYFRLTEKDTTHGD